MDVVNNRRATFKKILNVTSGNFLEQYDFFLFGFYATYIAAKFFHSENEYVSLMMTFTVFAAGFLMRPLGAIFLGAYVDRVGRRKGLIVTLSLMAIGTILITFVPGYETIGIIAPILVVIGRLLQGFSNFCIKPANLKIRKRAFYSPFTTYRFGYGSHPCGFSFFSTSATGT